VRALHAAPELGKVEVLFNGAKQLDEFEYGTTSDWIEIDPGVVRITISRDRAGINYFVFDAIAPVVANEDYNLIISDPLVIPAPVDRSPLPPDTSRVRVVHASVDIPAVDIALEYAQLSDPVEVPAGSYDLEVRLHSTGEVALDLPGVVAEPSMIYDLVAYGKPGNDTTPLTVATLTDEARAGTAATPTA
jgi:hypothetical protein